MAKAVYEAIAQWWANPRDREVDAITRRRNSNVAALHRYCHESEKQVIRLAVCLPLLGWLLLPAAGLNWLSGAPDAAEVSREVFYLLGLRRQP